MPGRPTIIALIVLLFAGTLLFPLECHGQEGQPEQTQQIPPSDNAATTEIQPAPTTTRQQRQEARRERRRMKNQPLDLPDLQRRAYEVVGGQKRVLDSLETQQLVDSLGTSIESIIVDAPGTPASDSVQVSVQQEEVDSAAVQSPLAREADMGLLPPQISTTTATQTTQIRDSTLSVQEVVDGETVMDVTGTVVAPDSVRLSRRDSRMRARQIMRADTTLFGHSPIFRDTIPISRLTALSIIAPGLGQLYNGHYWKIPVLYATVGTAAYMGFKQHSAYRIYKRDYDELIRRGVTDRDILDPVQTKMIRHNTWRQLLFAGAIGTYIYFLGDAVVNYPVQLNGVKAATTLSTIFPGAGQFYNGSYWRGVIVAGGFATFMYVINFNNNYYQIYKRALETYPNNGMNLSEASLLARRKNAKRNRDLCIILTAAFYALNIIDAHVDAHLKDYDVSDDLSFRINLTPTINTMYTQASGNQNVVGLGLNITF